MNIATAKSMKALQQKSANEILVKNGSKIAAKIFSEIKSTAQNGGSCLTMPFDAKIGRIVHAAGVVLREKGYSVEINVQELTVRW